MKVKELSMKRKHDNRWNFTRRAFVMIMASILLWLPSIGKSQTTLEKNQSPASPQYVLTRLGAVYEGTLVDRGDSYSIEFEGGGAASISKLDALCIGNSREDIYQYKATKMHLEDVNEVLKLADWASRRQMASQAIKTIEEKLKDSTDDAERKALLKKLGELQKAETIRIDVAKAVAARERAKGTDNLLDKPNKEIDPELVELEEWAKDIPYETLERFNRKAQPILQKRCGDVGCHSTQDQSRYTVLPKGIGAAARKASLSNFRATLQRINFDNISTSPILDHPTVQNAKGERVYPFGNDRSSLKDCEKFVEWIDSLKKENNLAERVRETQLQLENEPMLRSDAASRYDLVAATDRTNATSENLAQSSESPESDASFADLFDASPNENSTQTNSDDVLKFGVPEEAKRFLPKEEDDVNSRASILKRAGMTPQKEYRDAYDPNIFNDRYHLNDKE